MACRHASYFLCTVPSYKHACFYSTINMHVKGTVTKDFLGIFSLINQTHKGDFGALGIFKFNSLIYYVAFFRNHRSVISEEKKIAF